MITFAYKVGGWGEKRPKICLRNIWMVPNQSSCRGKGHFSKYPKGGVQLLFSADEVIGDYLITKPIGAEGGWVFKNIT